MTSSPWPRWRRQTLNVARFEIRRILAGRRWLAVFLLAWSLPALLLLQVSLAAAFSDDGPASAPEMGQVFAGIFQSYVLRLAVFFGCVVAFTHLVRGDVLEKTLHYYFLSPVRREIVMAGKYLAGLVQVSVLFVPATIVSYVLMHVPTGSRALEAHFAGGAGIPHALTYAGITLLACVGYGAVFLLMGTLFRNPLLPAVAVFAWEGINLFLPPVLQKISVIHYLQSLSPVPLPFGPLAVITEPTSPWISVPGMLLTTAAVLALAAFRLQRAEISYAVD